MLSIFRTNQPLSNVLLLVYLAVLRFSAFIHPTSVAPKSQGILTQWIYAEMPPNSQNAFIAAFVLVFFQAVFINIIVSRFRIATEATLFPGLFYCLVTSLMPDFLTLSPILLANTFLIWSMLYLLDIYKNPNVVGRIFDVGLCLGLASLFHFSFVLFLIWGILGIGILRGLRPKEFLMFILGFLVPFFLFWVFLYWIDRPDLLLRHFTNNFGYLSFVKHPSLTKYLKLGIMGVLLLSVVLSSGQLLGRRNVTTQKYLSVLYWLLLVSGFSVFMQSNIDLNHMMIEAVPLSILVSLGFQRISAPTAEVLHMLLIMFLFLLHFEYLIVAQ